MKICERCGIDKVIKSNDEFYHLYPASTKLRKGHGQAILMTGLKPNTLVFYFATTFSDKIGERDEAYGALRNSGVVRTTSEGTATFYLDCPAVYRTPSGRIYPRHFHWVYWNGSQWGRTVYAQDYFCPVNKSFVKRAKGYLIIDALPREYYDKKHIPGAINIPHNKPVSDALLRKLLGEDKTVPIIIYCWSPECSAAEHLNAKLQRLGWLNTFHYEKGISNW